VAEGLEVVQQISAVDADERNAPRSRIAIRSVTIRETPRAPIAMRRVLVLKKE
jgi:hypothetical protein